MAKELKVVGKWLPRKEAPALVMGQPYYVSDIYLPGMLHGRYLTSPYAHAEIKRIDTSKAKALRGVKAVLTYADIGPIAMSKIPTRNMFPLTEKARAVGDAIAAVAADTVEIAEEALSLIEVEYNVLPHYTDPREAMKPGAAEIHAKDHGVSVQPGNFWTDDYIARWGDVEAGKKEANKIYQYQTVTQGCSNHQSEPRCAVASWENDELTLWVTCQGVYEERGNQSRDLKISMSKIRAICRMTGGGFGSNKFGRHGYIATLLAKATGRPVRVEHSRRLELGFEAHGRTRTYQDTKIGVKSDGNVTFVEYNYIAQTGAYSQDTANQYQGWRDLRVPNVGGRASNVYTNTAKGGFKRGVPDPIVSWAREPALDKIAEDRGVNPLDYRFLTMETERDRSRAANLQPYLSCAWKEALEAVGKASGFKDKWKGWKTPMAVNGSKRRGIGVGVGTHNAGNQNASAIATLKEDGKVLLKIGTTDPGCGQRSTQSMICAEALGVRYEDVDAWVGDTEFPEAPRSAGSTQAFSASRASKMAGLDLRRVILEKAAPLLKVTAAELDMVDAVIFVKADPTKKLTLAEATSKFWGSGTPYSLFPLIIGYGATEPLPDRAVASFAAYVFEVEVDVDTGGVELINSWNTCDCGQPISAEVVHQQIYGGGVDGITMGLFEDRIWDPQSGVCLTTDWESYKLPTILDVGEPHVLLSAIDYPAYVPEEPIKGIPGSAFGAKGFSEGASVAVHCAIANAVYNACGARVNELPVTPAKIIKALGKG